VSMQRASFDLVRIRREAVNVNKRMMLEMYAGHVMRDLPGYRGHTTNVLSISKRRQE